MCYRHNLAGPKGWPRARWAERIIVMGLRIGSCAGGLRLRLVRRPQTTFAFKAQKSNQTGAKPNNLSHRRQHFAVQMEKQVTTYFYYVEAKKVEEFTRLPLASYVPVQFFSPPVVFLPQPSRHRSAARLAVGARPCPHWPSELGRPLLAVGSRHRRSLELPVASSHPGPRLLPPRRRYLPRPLPVLLLFHHRGLLPSPGRPHCRLSCSFLEAMDGSSFVLRS
jgi:hypothetical protein